jgi:hypothetical protein
MRSKGCSPLQEIIKENGTGKLYFHGKRDTYNVRKPNQFVWNQVGASKGEKDIYCDYKGMQAFWQGLNTFRNSPKGQIFRQAKTVSSDYYRFILPENNQLMGYVVDNQVFVLLNVSDQVQQFKSITLPEGNWKLVCNGFEFNHTNGVKGEQKNVKGGKIISLSCPAASGLVWIREK